MKSNFYICFEGMDEELKLKSIDTTKHREDEVVFYAKIVDFEGLSKAAEIEMHDQWEIKQPKGRIRVRKTVVLKSLTDSGIVAPEGQTALYVQTIKTRDTAAGIAGGTEINSEINKDFFESFKAMAPQGMVKTRYTVPTNKIVVKIGEDTTEIKVDSYFEIDVFSDKDGKPHEWCKVDVEVNSILEAIAKEFPGVKDANFEIDTGNLPFDPANVIFGKDEVSKKKVSELYDKYFLTFNGKEENAA